MPPPMEPREYFWMLCADIAGGLAAARFYDRQQWKVGMEQPDVDNHATLFADEVLILAQAVFDKTSGYDPTSPP